MRRAADFGSDANARIALASEVGFRGSAHKMVGSSRSSSIVPPARVAMTGVPSAIASRDTMALVANLPIRLRLLISLDLGPGLGLPGSSIPSA